MIGIRFIRLFVALSVVLTQSALGPHLVTHLDARSEGVAVTWHIAAHEPSVTPSFEHNASHVHLGHIKTDDDANELSDVLCTYCVQHLNAAPHGVARSVCAICSLGAEGFAPHTNTSALLERRASAPSIRGPPRLV